ncbi:MAG TPA: chemotaxis protein CheB [Caulobacteraceae bacterium]|jgi:two-component system chemotaxis response regulator CheB|nr:chemotaxis protein CheB [Caulobacteraceae bacterium]
MAHRDIIAIAGSTGGLEATKTLCSALPADLPAAVLLVIHVGAQSRNLLAQSLRAGCALPVHTAIAGERVERGGIYVAPADRHLLVIDGRVRLGEGPRENMSRPAADPLFRSVGMTYGPRAIGVVLTGRLNDGAAGLADLKRCGGVSVVQSPLDAVAPDMPLGALRACDIDYRGPVAGLGDLLTRLVSQEAPPAPPVPPHIELEVDIALGRPCLSETIAQLADPAPLTCPACSGVLSRIRREPPLRFRCQVGHGYTAEALAMEKDSAVGEAVRIALGIVEERAVLCERMADEARTASRLKSASSFDSKADDLRGYADTLRRAALDDRIGSDDGGSDDGAA